MDYFNLTKIKHIVITFENLEQIVVPRKYIEAMGVERTKWPMADVFDHIPYSTHIFFDKEIYRSPDIFNRLCRARDISWVDVIFENGKKCQWSVPWDDDPNNNDENYLQRNNEFEQGFTIHISDYIEVLE